MDNAYGRLMSLISAATPTPTPTPGPVTTAPGHGIQLFGVHLIGINASTGEKALLTLIVIAVAVALRYALYGGARLILPGGRNERVRFWTRQGISVVLAVIVIVGLISVWFENPGSLTTVLGLITAGVAIALQKVITALAGYVVILRGNTFSVGDRIVMGGVRGDVIRLGFIQTTIMEMGQPPPVQQQGASPATWVKARQYTGRVVVVTNDTIFNSPVYNLTRDFSYLWDEMTIPISYKDDRRRAEQIMLECARHHALGPDTVNPASLHTMQQRYALRLDDLEPRVYYRLTDNWVALTVRFLYDEHGIRDVRDAMSRAIIDAFDEAGIGIASSTYDVVGFPPIRIEGGALHISNGTPRDAAHPQP